MSLFKKSLWVLHSKLKMRKESSKAILLFTWNSFTQHLFLISLKRESLKFSVNIKRPQTYFRNDHLNKICIFWFYEGIWQNINPNQSKIHPSLNLKRDKLIITPNHWYTVMPTHPSHLTITNVQIYINIFLLLFPKLILFWHSHRIKLLWEDLWPSPNSKSLPFWARYSP